MAEYVVVNQAELDAALAAHRDEYADIIIASPKGVWLEISDSGRCYVSASGSASVRASGSASVRASGSASVSAFDSASVRASGSASVSAFDSASVRASGSASVSAFDSASVRASGSASVRAFDSASVSASGSASVRAGKYVSVHLHSSRVRVEGGVVIDVTKVNQADPEQWAEYTGCTVVDGHAHLYKAVDADLTAGHAYIPTRYPVGGDVTASDWRNDARCGGGLHASPWPEQALAYYSEATRMVVVAVPLADLRPIPSDGQPAKAKARTVRVLREVTLTGDPLPENGA